MGAAGLSAYSASKHALRGLCDCLRLEVREEKCSFLFSLSKSFYLRVAPLTC